MGLACAQAATSAQYRLANFFACPYWTATAIWAPRPGTMPVIVTNMPGLVYQSVASDGPPISGIPLAIAALSKAETRLSEDTMMALTPSAMNCCPAAWAVAGSPLSSMTMTWTGWPSMPPLALIQAAQAGATVAPWSLEEACAPVSEPITPILISAPFGAAAADVPLAAAPDDEELLLLLPCYARGYAERGGQDAGQQRRARECGPARQLRLLGCPQPSCPVCPVDHWTVPPYPCLDVTPWRGTAGSAPRVRWSDHPSSRRRSSRRWR